MTSLFWELPIISHDFIIHSTYSFILKSMLVRCAEFNIFSVGENLPETIKVGVVTINMLSIGTKFENFVQAGSRDLGSHRGQCGRTVYCRKPIILPKLVLFFGKVLELPVLRSIICVWTHKSSLET